MSNALNITRGSILIIGLIFTIFGSKASAENTPLDIKKFFAQRQGAPAFKIDFIQEKHSFLFKSPLISKGYLSFEPPSLIIKQTESPIQETLVIDGSTVTIDIKRQVGQQRGSSKRSMSITEHPALAGFITSLQAFILGDLKSLQAYFEVSGTRSAKQYWHMTLTSRNRDLKKYFKQIEFTGSSLQPNKITITEAGGDTIVMKLLAKNRTRVVAP